MSGGVHNLIWSYTVQWESWFPFNFFIADSTAPKIWSYMVFLLHKGLNSIIATHLSPASLISSISIPSKSLNDSIWNFPILNSLLSLFLVHQMYVVFLTLLSMGQWRDDDACKPARTPSGHHKPSLTRRDTANSASTSSAHCSTSWRWRGSRQRHWWRRKEERRRPRRQVACSLALLSAGPGIGS